MRKLSILVGLLITGLGLGGVSRAATLEWSGTLLTNTGTLPPRVHLGTGVATVNGTGGLGHLNTIYIASGLTYTGGANVPEVIPLTDPATPTLISLRATGGRIGKRLGTPGQGIGGVTFDAISGGPPLGTKAAFIPAGRNKMCILFPGCAAYLPIEYGNWMGTQGVGIGGVITVNTFSKGNGFKLSLYGAPWTIGVASIKGVTTTTPNGGITTYTKTLQGFLHGPASNTSSTAAISGAVQVIAPTFIETNLGAPDTYQAVWAQVTLQFIPEPGLLLLLGSGVAGLLVLGAGRVRP